MKIGNGNFKAQSAMEYLMTYGWAILIIAVVLAALFSLNVFNAGANLGTSCIPSPGFLCQSPVLSGSTGTISFTVGQNAQLSSTGTAYNASFSCISASNSSTPGGTIPMIFNTISATGAALAPTVKTSSALGSGSQLTLTGIQCYGQSGHFSATQIGTVFTGSIFMAYNQTTNTGKANLYTKVATISVRTAQ